MLIDRFLIFGCDYERIPSDDSDVVDRSVLYNQIDSAKKYMLPFEVRILELLFFGHGPTSIAKIVGYNSRQHGLKLIKTIIQIVRFFCNHHEQIERMIGDCDISPDDCAFLKLLFVDRYPYKWVAIRHNKTVDWVDRRVKRLRDRQPKYSGLISEYIALSTLRSGWCFDMWRRVFCDYICTLQNRGIWYEWGGQCIKNGIADCSGLVIEVYKKLGMLPDKFADTTANGLAKLYKKTNNPEPGDLVFYGKNWDRVTHVMFYYGTLEYDGDRLPGSWAVGMAGGGGSKTKKWHAKKFGIGLWFRRVDYRKDLLGIKKVTRIKK